MAANDRVFYLSLLTVMIVSADIRPRLEGRNYGTRQFVAECGRLADCDPIHDVTIAGRDWRRIGRCRQSGPVQCDVPGRGHRSGAAAGCRIQRGLGGSFVVNDRLDECGAAAAR